MLEQFITSIDYDKLIKMQASRVLPYNKAVDIKKSPKKNNSPKVKTIGRKK